MVIGLAKIGQKRSKLYPTQKHIFVKMPSVRRMHNSSLLYDRQVNETDKERGRLLEKNCIRISQTRSIMTPERRIQLSWTRSVRAYAQRNSEIRLKRRLNMTII